MIVLFDGRCGLCRETITWLRRLDWLSHLAYVDIHDTERRMGIAPDVPFDVLNAAMHVRLPDGSYRRGFRGLRALSWHLPLLWIMGPFLYLPGVAWAGDRIYRWIAARTRCTAGCRVG